MPKKRIRLGSFIKEYTVRNKKNENIPVYSVTNSQGFCTQYFDKEIASKDKSSYKIVPKGYFAYNPSRIDVGSVDWQRNEEKVIVSPLYNVFSVSDQMDNEYIFFFLKSDFAKTMIKGKSTGSVRNNLKLDMLKEMTVPDISLEEQKYRALTLNKLQKIINLQKMRIKKLDELIKARFVEIFGDPISNPMGWDKVEINDCLINIENGKSFVCDDVMRVGNNPAILKLSAVTYGIYNPDENKAIIDENDFIDNAEVHAGDLLFTRKNTPELVGMAAYVFSTPKKLMMPDLIFRLNTNNGCNKIYLWQLINHDLFRRKIQNIASGSAKSMSNISKEKLRKLVICLPPIELQNQFATFVAEVDKSKAVVQKALDQAQILFDSLMQEYFR